MEEENKEKKSRKRVKKEVVKEEKTEQELRDEFFDAKEDKESIVGKILNVILWLVLFAWIAVCLVDFYKTRKREEPLFTFKKYTQKYEDGEVTSYTGLGYKIFDYNRKCYNGIEFGPFWTKDGSIKSETCSK